MWLNGCANIRGREMDLIRMIKSDVCRNYDSDGIFDCHKMVVKLAIKLYDNIYGNTAWVREIQNNSETDRMYNMKERVIIK